MSNCLDCPDEQNYAAIALQLQETALQAEQCLYDAEVALRAAVNPATIVRTTSINQSVAANVKSSIGTISGVTTFANSPRVNVVAISTLWEPGVWHVGACITAVASGVVDVESYRQLYIEMHKIGTAASIPNKFIAITTETEPNNGQGVDMTNHTTMIIPDSGWEVQFYFMHGNTSSSVNVNAGAMFWATRLSDATALRVV